MPRADWKRFSRTSPGPAGSHPVPWAVVSKINGQVIRTCMQKNRHQEWIRFLNLIDRSTPPGKKLHLICDNYATHQHAAVKAWAKRHPRFQFHFSPISASWLNMVRRFFRDLTKCGLRRGVFKNVPQLIAAIEAYPAAHHSDPKPFVWTASARDIPEKVKHGRQNLANMQSA